MSAFPADSAAAHGLACCHVCRKLAPEALHECPRCGAGLHLRDWTSLQKTVALLVTASILYIPANALPIMMTDQFGNASPSTILGGVVFLVHHGSYPVAAVIFVASVLVPLSKLVIMFWLCWSVARHNPASPRQRTVLYRVTEFIGRWSMTDVFVVAILVALIHFGGVLTITPGPAALAFAGVVVVTMLAAEEFDPRLIWTGARGPMADATATVSKRRRISAIWVVPIVAVLIGVWMLIYEFRNQGPEVKITFATAEGIEAGKTKVKARSVELGLVEEVTLADDLESVVVTAQLDPVASELLRADTEFWVVRARVGAGGISGLGTIVSGGYIELAPGEGERGRRHFVGLEAPPVTPVGAPGLKLSLVSSEVGSVGPGDTILYRGFPVGRVESKEFDVESQKVHYGAFIDAPYDDLVDTSTRFWNASGISFSASADGIELRTGSLQSVLLGGVEFGLPEGVRPGRPVEDGVVFDLYADRASVDRHPYRHSLDYVVRFERSIRGLRPGAPVEYRGIPAGSVVDILLEELAREPDRAEGSGAPIPVLIRVEPGRMKLPDTEQGAAAMARNVQAGVANGLRATLSTGSLLTGSLYVALDFYPDEPPASLGTFADHPTIPAVASGLEGIEHRITNLLDNLNDLPLDSVVRSVDDTLAELEATLVDARTLLSGEETARLVQSLEQTLSELDRTLRGVNGLVSTLEDRPSSLIFSDAPAPDPEPPAGSP